MKHNKKKLLIIVDELMMLFLKLGCTGITMNFDTSEKDCTIRMKGNYHFSFRSNIQNLEKMLNCGRNIEMEECYWSVSGAAEINQGSELHVIGSMLDSCSVVFDDNTLEITAFRKS